MRYPLSKTRLERTGALLAEGYFEVDADGIGIGDVRVHLDSSAVVEAGGKRTIELFLESGKGLILREDSASIVVKDLICHEGGQAPLGWPDGILQPDFGSQPKSIRTVFRHTVFEGVAQRQGGGFHRDIVRREQTKTVFWSRF